MKYIFLDIDGVLVPAKSWEVPVILEDGFPAFSSKSVAVLSELIANHTVILTTSHKSNYSIEEWQRMFKLRGLKVSAMMRLPENVDNLNRREELMNWFADNVAPKYFVIIDDDKSLNSLPDQLKSNLVLTSSMIGLTGDHIKEIKSILEKNKPAN